MFTICHLLFVFSGNISVCVCNNTFLFLTVITIFNYMYTYDCVVNRLGTFSFPVNFCSFGGTAMQERSKNQVP